MNALRRFVSSVLAAAAVFAAATVQATSLTWNQNLYTGNWDVGSSTNWKLTNPPNTTGQTFANGDDVTFPTFATLAGGSHYTHRTVTVAAGGVSPNSIVFRPAEINYLHFAGGDIAGCAGGITVDSTWTADQAQLHFDRNASYSFTGDITVEEGCHVYYRPAAAGTYSLGTGTIRVKDDPVKTNTTTFNYEPTVTGTTLTNNVRAETGTLTFNWGNAPVFTGTLTLDGNIFFNSVGGGYEYFDWNGNVVLTGDRKIIGGVRDLTGRPAGGGLHFGGQFQGAAHTLTLDFQGASGGAGLGMQAMLDTTAWNVGNLILTNGFGNPYFGSGNTPNLLVYTTNPTDDHFALLRGNGGKVTIQNNAMLMLRRGTINFADLQSDATGKVLFDMTNAAYDVRLSGAGMALSSAAGAVRNAVVGQGTGALGLITGPITIGNGGLLTLDGQYGKALRHGGGDLTLTGGSVLLANWGLGGVPSVSLGYSFESNTQKMVWGDGSAATPETVTVRLRDRDSSVDRTATFFLPNNVTDDGNVVMRYETVAAAQGVSSIGYADYTFLSTFTYASTGDTVAFRSASAGNEFAPANFTNHLGVVGAKTGTVFTATSPTRLTTAGLVGFYNNRGGGHGVGHRGNPGPVVIGSGGTFQILAGGTARALSFTVNSGGLIGGNGLFDGAVTVQGGGTLAPGNSAGTLTMPSLALEDGAIYQWEMQQNWGPYDSVVITGAGASLVLPTNLTIDLRNLGDTALPSQSFALFRYAGDDPVTLPTNLTFLTANSPYPISFDVSTQLVLDAANNLVLLTGITAVPEPGALALLAAAGLLLAARRRRT